MKTAVGSEEPRRRRGFKIVALVAGWMVIATAAFAVFNGSATGTLVISTTSPEAGTVTFVPGSSITFAQAGTSDLFEVQVALTAAGGGPYASFTTNATSVQSGPCAGFISIAAGQTRTFAPGGTITAGETKQQDNPNLTATIDAAAPPACANQASINLPISLTLNPV